MRSVMLLLEPELATDDMYSYFAKQSNCASGLAGASASWYMFLFRWRKRQLIYVLVSPAQAPADICSCFAGASAS